MKKQPNPNDFETQAREILIHLDDEWDYNTDENIDRALKLLLALHRANLERAEETARITEAEECQSIAMNAARMATDNDNFPVIKALNEHRKYRLNALKSKEPDHGSE